MSLGDLQNLPGAVCLGSGEGRLFSEPFQRFSKSPQVKLTGLFMDSVPWIGEVD